MDIYSNLLASPEFPILNFTLFTETVENNSQTQIYIGTRQDQLYTTILLHVEHICVVDIKGSSHLTCTINISTSEILTSPSA
jgi:hypothetical protein